LRYAGDLASAEVLLREAAQIAEQAGDAPGLIESQRALARVYSLDGSGHRACAELEQAIKAALRYGDVVLVCDCYRELSYVLVRRGLADEAAQELVEGILLVTRGDTRAPTYGATALAKLVARVAEVKLGLNQLDEARRFAERALAVSDGEGSPHERARLHSLAACIARVAGDGARAADHRMLALASARESGDRRGTAEQLLALADEGGAHTGDVPWSASRRAWLLEADRLARQIDWPEGSWRSRERLRQLSP